MRPGALETAYLTYEKLTGGTVACPIGGGCTSVLASAYADVHAFGATLPLAAVGCGAYALVSALGVKGARNGGEGERAGWERALGLQTGWERWALAGTTSLMAATSGCLMWVLAARLHTECAYCIGSAVLSSSLCVTSLRGLSKDDLRAFAPYGIGTAAALVVAFGAAYGGVEEQQQTRGGALPLELAYAPPEIDTESSPRALAIAERLAKADARFYGAFWCSHCKDQKLTLGRQAMAKVRYVECFPSGWKKGEPLAPECSAAGVKGFPWWVINGEVTSGEMSLDELENVLDGKGKDG
eukprot:PRCOL_00003732-RA